MRRTEILAGLILLAAVGPGAAQESRGMRVVYQAPAGGNQGLSGDSVIYENSFAVVVGIDNYAKGLDELSGAARDARSVAQALQRQGFKVTLLLNEKATREAITGALGDKMPERVGREDRVLVFFAGHGVTKGEGDTAMGYLMPHDGDQDRTVTTGISMREMQNWFELYKSKHVMFVADACYSGLALNTRAAGFSKASKDYLKQVTSLPARFTLVAGRKGEQANELPGQGLFTKYFLSGIEGSADANGDGIITADELSAYVKPNVSQTALAQLSRKQNPQSARSGEGEFVFLSPRVSGPAVTPGTEKPVAAAPGTDYGKLEKDAERAKDLEKAWGIVSRMGADREKPRKNRLDALDRFAADFPVDNPRLAEARTLRRAVMAEAEAAPVDEAPPVQEGGKAGIQWISIPGGSFMMGSEEYSSEKPRHSVTVKAFQMAKTEVTNKQYKACVAAGACKAATDYGGGFSGDDNPAVGVDWNDAKAFSEWVGGRLPSEAQWEYAARSAGKDRKYPWGDEDATCERAVISGCGNATAPVCSKTKGNTAQGLCDMAGNAWEWTQDWYHSSYAGAPSDGSAWESPTGSYRVVRGGSWGGFASYARAAIRGFFDPAGRFINVSFRPVR